MRHMVRIDSVASSTYKPVHEVLVCQLFDVQRLGRLWRLLQVCAQRRFRHGKLKRLCWSANALRNAR